MKRPLSPQVQHEVQLQINDIVYLLRQVIEHGDLSIVHRPTLKAMLKNSANWAAEAQRRREEREAMLDGAVH